MCHIISVFYIDIIVISDLLSILVFPLFLFLFILFSYFFALFFLFFSIFFYFSISIFPEYYDVIKKPTDITTIKENINNYTAVEEVLKDIRQIWKNCRLFNFEGSKIAITAGLLGEELEAMVEVGELVLFVWF